MPTYAYACSSCGHEYDRFESIKAEPNTTCIKCEKSTAVRKFTTGGGFIFKGSGFYVTDYKKSGAAPSTGATPEKTATAAPAAAPAGGCSTGCACH